MTRVKQDRWIAICLIVTAVMNTATLILQIIGSLR